MVYVQRIGASEVKMLPGTQNASFPFWSPDNAFLAFFANGKLLKMSASGGTPQALGNALQGRGGSWGTQNVIVYAPDSSASLWRVNGDGSGAAPLIPEQMWKLHLDQASLDQSDRWPVFLPDGKHFLYWAGNFSNAKDDTFSGIYLSSLDDPNNKKLVQLCRCSFAYDSQDLYYADAQRQLVRIAFDPSNGKISGSPLVVSSAVGFQPSTFRTAVTVAANGTVVFSTGVGAAMSVLTWMDRTGKGLGRIGEPAILANPTLSPDGARGAVDVSDPKANNVDVWLESTRGGGNTRFTFDPAEEVAGVWSRDGTHLAYRLASLDGSRVVTKATSGLEREKALVTNPVDDFVPNSWSADDQQLLYTTRQAPLHEIIMIIPAAGGKAMPFITSSDNQADAQISGDGKWVAYASDESGNWEIYVTSFPSAAGKWQVSRGGGSEPRWRGDGKEIFYIGPAGMLMTVAVSSENGFSTGAPAPLFQIHGRAPISSTDAFTYDVTKDGQRFLVNRYVPPEQAAPLTVSLNAGQ
jgi:Tol biopolymer transport system component